MAEAGHCGLSWRLLSRPGAAVTKLQKLGPKQEVHSGGGKVLSSPGLRPMGLQQEANRCFCQLLVATGLPWLGGPQLCSVSTGLPEGLLSSCVDTCYRI